MLKIDDNVQKLEVNLSRPASNGKHIKCIKIYNHGPSQFHLIYIRQQLSSSILLVTKDKGLSVA